MAIATWSRRPRRALPRRIPGSRTPKHIEENLAAAHVRLDADVLGRLERILGETEVEGGTLL
ncbi:hypothetical protein [Streptomyces sp. PA5.6]|uniref:hypothetical protein n=1 Tax=Streptomyces sp. PA5.6 TaxID=3035651 RepID=UPI003904ADDE